MHAKGGGVTCIRCNTAAVHHTQFELFVWQPYLTRLCLGVQVQVGEFGMQRSSFTVDRR